MELFDVVAVIGWVICVMGVVAGVAVLDSRKQLHDLTANQSDRE